MDNRFANIQQLLTRKSHFGNETGVLANGEFEPSQSLFDSLSTAKVLVIGAGGLGCEILKDLALSGVKDIHLIDLDTIDLTNLNRQFLFRLSDVGRNKSDVAAEFIMKRVPGCVVTPYQGKIQDFPPSFYKQFKIVVSGLDNIEARRWLNSTLADLVEKDEDGEIDYSTIIPMIDGGTEGLKGQARIILPFITSCFECSVSSITPQKGFAMCTVASTPRLPEHCIAYAMMLEWGKHSPSRSYNTDSPEDMQWIYQCALKRSEEYGIVGVTYFLTLGVVKNIIPAVASTNAIISSACVNEVMKFLTFASQSMNTYFLYVGTLGIYSPTLYPTPHASGRREDCLVCNPTTLTRTMEKHMTLEDFSLSLKEEPEFQLNKPSFMTPIEGSDRSVSLYFPSPPSLELTLRPNLSKTLYELLGKKDGNILSVSDPALTNPIEFRILFNSSDSSSSSSNSSSILTSTIPAATASSSAFSSSSSVVLDVSIESTHHSSSSSTQTSDSSTTESSLSASLSSTVIDQKEQQQQQEEEGGEGEAGEGQVGGECDSDGSGGIKRKRDVIPPL